ncbi:Tetratricopeptide repeat protein 14, partial [Entomortierella chlamydospora]
MDSFAAGIDCAQKGQLDDAIKAYSQAIQIDAKCVEAYVARGCTLANIKKWRAAIMDFRAALSLDPSNVSAQQYLESTIAQEEEHRLNPTIDDTPSNGAENSSNITMFNGGSNLDNINEIVLDTEVLESVIENSNGNNNNNNNNNKGNNERKKKKKKKNKKKNLSEHETSFEIGIAIEVETGVEIEVGIEAEIGVGIEAETELAIGMEIDTQGGHRAVVDPDRAHLVHDRGQDQSLDQGQDRLPVLGVDRGLEAQQGITLGIDHDLDREVTGKDQDRHSGQTHDNEDSKTNKDDETSEKRGGKEAEANKDRKEDAELKDSKDGKNGGDQKRRRSKSNSRSRSREQSRSKSTRTAGPDHARGHSPRHQSQAKDQDKDSKGADTHLTNLTESNKDNRDMLHHGGDRKDASKDEARDKKEPHIKRGDKEAINSSKDRLDDQKELAPDAQKKDDKLSIETLGAKGRGVLENVTHIMGEEDAEIGRLAPQRAKLEILQILKVAPGAGAEPEILTTGSKVLQLVSATPLITIRTKVTDVNVVGRQVGTGSAITVVKVDLIVAAGLVSRRTIRIKSRRGREVDQIVVAVPMQTKVESVVDPAVVVDALEIGLAHG